MQKIFDFIKENLVELVVIIIVIACMAIIGFLVVESNNSGSKQKAEVETSLYALSEYAYSEGQKDALMGDIRIEKMNDIWIWKKSPWDNGRPPVHMQLQYYDMSTKDK
jgi:predicted negative regulator of RcsB-dependent stress response